MRRTSEVPAMPGREVLVVRIDVPGIVIESRFGGWALRRVPEGQVGYVDRASEQTRLRRPPSRDDAEAFRRSVRVPGDVPPEAYAERVRGLREAMMGTLSQQVDMLRRCYAIRGPTSFSERAAMLALERVTLAEIASGLDVPRDEMLAIAPPAAWR